MDSILCANPGMGNRELESEINIAVSNVLMSGNYILGTEVQNFEIEFAEYLGSEYCIGVNSGTDAILLSLKGLGISTGDEVIVPSHTAVATIAAIVAVGAIPVFADIQDCSMTIDPVSVQELITRRTRAIIAVHLYGFPCDIDELKAICKQHDLYLVEDCAQAHGATYKGRKVGTFGDAGCFSFYPTKNLGALGDAGAIVTGDSRLASKLLALRQYGWNEERISIFDSAVSRLDEIQAAVLRLKLLRLEEYNNGRNRIANFYRQNLKNLNLVLPEDPIHGRHVYHLFVIQIDQRALIISKLNSIGIYPGIHYPKPAHMHDVFKKYNQGPEGRLSKTEKLSTKILSLPMYPELSRIEMERVTEAIQDIA